MLPVARLSDTHVCPIHGPNAITSGGSATADNLPVARLGDSTGCGATIVQGSSISTCDGKPVAYQGCTTSHGGVITSGSPTQKVQP